MIGWECLFYHSTYKVILSVYVDDFKMAGREAGMRKAWNAIRGPDKLVLDEPTAFGPYLGCEQSRSTIDGKEAYERLKNILPLLSNKLAAKQSDLVRGSSGELAKLKIPTIRWEMDGFFTPVSYTHLTLPTT